MIDLIQEFALHNFLGIFLHLYNATPMILPLGRLKRRSFTWSFIFGN